MSAKIITDAQRQPLSGVVLCAASVVVMVLVAFLTGMFLRSGHGFPILSASLLSAAPLVFIYYDSRRWRIPWWHYLVLLPAAAWIIFWVPAILRWTSDPTNAYELALAWAPAVAVGTAIAWSLSKMNDGPASDSPPSAQRRRWYQFRLQTLLLMVVGAAVLCGLFIPPYHQHRTTQARLREYEAAAAPFEGIGDVYRKTVADPSTWLKPEEHGKEAITGISFTPGAVTDADLERLRPHMEELPLHLVSLQRSGGVPMTVTDAGWFHLRGLCNLRVLDLRWAGFTDAGMAHLGDMPQLTSLVLEGCNITDDGLSHLQGLQQLDTLNLGYTNVTDDGLAYLKDLTHLEVLYLDDTDVTDDGLRHLFGLRQLRQLDVRDTQVTAEGAQRLAADLPNCSIYGYKPAPSSE